MMALGDVAAKLGVPVFPCLGNKKPAIAKGFQSATADPSAILTAFNRPGAELIGMPTGSASGLIAIDVDPRHGGSAWLNENQESLPETRTHRTPGGGVHLIFLCPDVEIRNSQGQVAAGVDVRGSGGYIIMPPSAGYAIADHVEPAEMPRWLIRACLPPERAKPVNGHATPTEIESKRLKAFYERELDRVRGANDGEKHEKLRNAALSIGGIADQAGLTEDSVWRDLQHALPASVEDWRGAERTARWGFQAGRGQPITLEDRPEYQRSEFSTKPAIKATDSPTDSAKKASLNSAPSPSPDLLQSYDIPQLIALPPPTWLVHNLLPSHGSAILYGPFASLKSFAVLGLSLSLAYGRQWMGRDVLPAAGVLYFAGEGLRGIGRRVLAWQIRNELTSTTAPFRVIPVGINLADDKHVELVISTAKYWSAQWGCPIGLIPIDTLARAMVGADENSAQDMGRAVSAMDRIREATGATTLPVHHTGKDADRGMRGSYALPASVDTVLRIERDQMNITLTIEKQKEDEEGEPISLKAERVRLGDTEDSAVSLVLVQGDICNVSNVAGRLGGRTEVAYRILCDAIVSHGEPDRAGVALGLPSIPEEWWRERFYERAMPAADRKTREKAFRRAADHLIDIRYVACNNGRVWACRMQNTHAGDMET